MNIMKSCKEMRTLSIIMALWVAMTGMRALGADKTGTNPANFTYDFRIITEMAELPDNQGSQSTQTFEVRWPLGRDVANLRSESEGDTFYDMGKRWGARFRVKHVGLSLNNPEGGTTEVSGIGDMDARLLYLAYASPNIIVVPGLEAFFDTASNDALGAGTTTLAPVIFTVFPNLVGKGSLFAPGYQYVFDVGSGAAISRSQIDLYFVWGLAQGLNWLILDPQIIIDHENDKTLGTCEVEWGFMMIPESGVSGYLRPGAGIGSNRPYEWNMEVGLKFVW